MTRSFGPSGYRDKDGVLRLSCVSSATASIGWRPMPERVQLRRTKGWRMPPNTVKVDRTTRWGNPFTVGMRLRTHPELPIAVLFSAQDCVDAYRTFLGHEIGRRFCLSVIAELRGRNLACWCPLDQPCHADVLLEIANRKEASE